MTNTEMKDCGILDELWDEIEAYAETRCSGDSINVYDVAAIIGKYRSLDGGCKLCKRKESESLEQKQKIGQFAKWVADEIFDENWEYNKDAFAELACRKLAKLGIVRAKGDEWELIEPQESEET